MTMGQRRAFVTLLIFYEIAFEKGRVTSPGGLAGRPVTAARAGPGGGAAWRWAGRRAGRRVLAQAVPLCATAVVTRLSMTARTWAAPPVTTVTFGPAAVPPITANCTDR